MTTAFAYAANGDLGASATTQPFGVLLAIGAAVAVCGGLHAGITGTNPLRLLPRGNSHKVTLILVSLFLAAWVYKMIVW